MALSQLGCKCVFASELKDDLRTLYSTNFPGTRIEGDITKIDPTNIPSHDILCGGFPCQPFSQAGKRQGFLDDKNRGTMFDYICDIIQVHHPKYLLLENVSNLLGHDGGKTWEIIKSRLIELGYKVDKKVISPHEFAIPQHRKRIYIVGIHSNLGSEFSFPFPQANGSENCSIESILEPADINYIPLKPVTRKYIDLWEEFLQLAEKNNVKIPGFPIWAMEFGADYDFEETAPAFQPIENLVGRKGHLGQEVQGNTVEECLLCLPKYSRTNATRFFPQWKISYIKKNREFYRVNKKWVSSWLKKMQGLDNSFLKLEWNCGDEKYTLSDKILQFRASGIRAKKAEFAPALNLVGTQIPIIPWIELPNGEKGRYLTINEAAKLQGMESLKFDGLTSTRIYEALGNAVNVNVVYRIVAELLKQNK